MKTAFQPSIREQRTLGGSAYARNETQFGSRTTHSGAGMWIVPERTIRTHFAPVASEELMENRRRVAVPARVRRRILPVIQATSRTLKQAEIGDALDSPTTTRLGKVTSTDPASALQPELESLMLDCQQPGWDGYGAEPVSMDAYHAAERFISSLPVGIPQPELSADPDGCVTFEWRKSPRCTLLVSVRPSNALDYAALMGTARAHGSEQFSSELPETLRNLIRRVIGA